MSSESKAETNNTNFTSIVFEGGGVLGVSHAGVIKYLEEVGLYKKINKFGGTSMGAIVATFCALGMLQVAKNLIFLDTFIYYFYFFVPYIKKNF
jgi:predicted acylesterase/phospholipase RssA